jgi:hypothetical protein
VLAAVDAGKPREEVAETFSVSMPTIKRWLKRRRETGDVEPKPIPGRPSWKGTMLRRWLPNQLETNHDLTSKSTARLSRKSSGRRFLPLPWDGPSPGCPEEAGRSKKVEGSPRARRGGKRPLAVAGFPLRCPAFGVRGRERVPHLHDAPLRSGAQGTEGLRPGTAQPGQEHHPDRRDHPRRSHGGVGGRRGSHRRGGL